MLTACSTGPGLDEPADSGEEDSRPSAIEPDNPTPRQSPDRLQARPEPRHEAADVAMLPTARVREAARSHAAAPPMPQRLQQVVDRENYHAFDDNPVHRVAERPVSTFSIDVDTGSYANVRRMLGQGRLPPTDAVRVEEMINYFDYDYPAPAAGQAPFSVTVEQAPTPWNPATRLLQIGIRGASPPTEAIPPANLVFLIDVSGSMNSADKLGLLRNGLKLLVGQLDAHDRVAMVVYAGTTAVVLESTPGDRHGTINAAIDRLSAGGSTNGGAGIALAYAQARQGFIEGGINRIVLATDGDFNVGTVSFEALLDQVKRQRKSGIALTTLGFGTGNYNDHLMEQLADAGDGNHAYIDTLNEARKVLVEEMHATLMTIARDVKIQLEFNPAVVAEYRLIGYENRALRREDFNNDAVDAGDIGAGHTVTALYEIALTGSGGERVDVLRYGSRSRATTIDGSSRELGFLRLRYKRPGDDSSRLIEQAIERQERDDTGYRIGFAAAVAAFGQYLRGGRYLEGYDLSAIHELASRSRGEDPSGYRGEFLQLLRLADSLSPADRA